MKKQSTRVVSGSCGYNLAFFEKLMKLSPLQPSNLPTISDHLDHAEFHII